MALVQAVEAPNPSACNPDANFRFLLRRVQKRRRPSGDFLPHQGAVLSLEAMFVYVMGTIRQGSVSFNPSPTILERTWSLEMCLPHVLQAY